MIVSAGSTGATTTRGLSTSTRTRLAEATSNWPLASSVSLRRCRSSVSARRWSASMPSPVRGVGPGDITEVRRIGGRFPRDRDPSAGELKIQIRLGNLQHGIVVGGLKPRAARGHDPPSGQGLIDRVGKAEHRRQSIQGRIARARRGSRVPRSSRRAQRADEERIAVNRLDLPRDRLDLAVGSIPRRAHK